MNERDSSAVPFLFREIEMLFTKIESFENEYRFLSNFAGSIMLCSRDVHVVNTLEHAYQAAKTDDPEEAKAICLAETPGIAKRMGQRVKLREDWDQIKDQIMYELVKKKFSITNHVSPLPMKLLATADLHLEEGNTWGDTYWGICNGKGQNKLGKILMRVRNELRDEVLNRI